MLAINRTDISIMQILENKSADNAAFGMTILELTDEIKEITSKSRMTIYRRLRNLTQCGYVAKGVLENHADTFYLTDKGNKALKGEF